MAPTEHESLLYFRRFPNSYGYCSIHHLFRDGNTRRGFFAGRDKPPLEWEVPCEFVSVDYGEPLKCVHARRAAFGGSEARIAEELDTPDRSLLFASSGYESESYGHVSVRWKPTGVMEVPRFCISSAISDQNRVQWGLGPHRLEMLKAALTLEPAQYDVFGFCTPDQRLFGAVEFTGERTNDLFHVHMFVVSSDRKLLIGDELWGWYTCDIGETRVEAKRCLAVVQGIPGLPVPPLARPGTGKGAGSMKWLPPAQA